MKVLIDVSRHLFFIDGLNDELLKRINKL